MKRKLPFFACLRVIAILAIISHHSICAFAGWPPNSALMSELPNKVYKVSGLLKSIGLDTFTFLAGWFAVGSIVKSKGCISFLVGKSRRILLPCIVAAVVYQLLFPQYMKCAFPSAINGTHLWYLPMIFVLFVMAYMCVKSSDNIEILRRGGGVMRVSLIAVVFIGLFCVPFLMPLRTFGEARGYWPIFSLGMLAAWYKDVYESFSVEFKLPEVVRTLDDHSFGIYIVHQFVINFLILRLAPINRYPCVTVVVMFVLTTVISLAFCLGCEKLRNWLVRKVINHE